MDGESGSSICGGEDSRIDNFIQFQPKGCLNQPVHFALYCTWFIFFMYNAIEMCAQFISPLPGRSVTATHLITQASYLAHVLLQAGFCLVVIIEPYASVLNRSQGLAMAIILVVSPACFILTLSQLGIEFTGITTKALLLSTGSILKDRQRHDFLYRAMVVSAILLPAIVAISNFVLFVILPFVVFTDPDHQQVSWNFGFIVMGCAFLIIAEVDATYWWRLRSIALEQIRFSSSLTGGGQRSDSLIRVAQNMQYLAVSVGIIGFVAPLLLIIVPAVYGLPYWFAQTIQGIISTIVIPIILLLHGSAISRIIWQARTHIINRDSTTGSTIAQNSNTSSGSLGATKQLSPKFEEEDATTAFDHNVPEKKTDDHVNEI